MYKLLEREGEHLFSSTPINWIKTKSLNEMYRGIHYKQHLF